MRWGTKLTRPCFAAVVVVLAATALVAGGSPAGAVPPDPLEDWEVASVPLANGAVRYDASRDQVLVAVSPSVPGLGNHLVELDPDTGALGRSTFVGGIPTSLAVSDDGTRAYVGFSGAALIAEVDLDAFEVVRRFPLGLEYPSGTRYAEDLEVQPGHPDVVVASMRNVGLSPRHEGVAAFDDGVARPDVTDDHTGADRITWGPDDDTLYGYNNETTGFGVYTLDLDADGVHERSEQRGLLSGFGVDVEYGSGQLVATSGRAVDPVTGSVLGTYPHSGAVELDEDAGHTWFLGDGTLSRHDTSTLLTEDTMAVPGVGGVRDLVDAGGAMVAADADQVVLLGPDVSAAGYVAPTGTSPALRPDLRRTVDLDATAVAAAPAGDDLYVATTSSDAEHPWAVVEVERASGEVQRSLFVGASPNQVEVSDDGSTLWVGHADANKVTEVDVATFEVARSITLPALSGEVTYAGDLEPVPGAADRFVVDLRSDCCPGNHEGVVLVVDGQVRGEPTWRVFGPTTLAFAGDASRLYGYNGASTGYNLSIHAVDDDGVERIDEHRRFLNGFRLTLETAGDLLYVSNGAVVDPEQPTVVGRALVSGMPAPVPAVDRAFYVDDERVSEVTISTELPVATHDAALGDDARDVAVSGEELAVARVGGLDLLPFGPVVPGAPTEVAAEPGDGQIEVSWMPPGHDGGSEITGYEVHRDGALVHEAGPDERSWTDDGVDNGDEHTYRVLARNAEGAGPASAPATATARTTPGAPTDLAAEAGVARVELSWAPAADDGGAPVTGYHVRRDGELVHEAGPDERSWVDHDAEPEVEHDYEVAAANEAGTGPASDPVSATALAPTFPDVGRDHPFLDDVEWMAAEGITGGYADGEFKPLAPVTRQSMSAFLYRLAGEPAFAVPGEPSFGDVPVGHPFFAEVEWMAAEGVTEGYADGGFHPVEPVTRQSMSAFLYRLAGEPAFAVPGEPSFGDVPVGHPFFAEVEWMAAEGIAEGYADGGFHPVEPVTRQSMAAFLHRLADGPGVGL